MAKSDQKQEQLLLHKMFLMLDNKRKVTAFPVMEPSLRTLFTVYLVCEGREQRTAVRLPGIQLGLSKHHCLWSQLVGLEKLDL